MLGATVRPGILLIRQYRDAEFGEPDDARTDIVRQATQERFAPILLTAVATALMLAPVIVLGNQPGLEVIRPVAIVVLGGLVTSTFFTLFVLPALYLRFARTPEPDLADPFLSPVSDSPEDRGASRHREGESRCSIVSTPPG